MTELQSMTQSQISNSTEIEKFIFYFFSPFQKQSPGDVCKKGALRNFAKFTGKHMCQSRFLIKFQALALQLYSKRDWHRGFLVNFAKFLRTPFLIELLHCLLLPFANINLQKFIHCHKASCLLLASVLLIPCQSLS